MQACLASCLLRGPGSWVQTCHMLASVPMERDGFEGCARVGCPRGGPKGKRFRSTSFARCVGAPQGANSQWTQATGLCSADTWQKGCCEPSAVLCRPGREELVVGADDAQRGSRQPAMPLPLNRGGPWGVSVSTRPRPRQARPQRDQPGASCQALRALRHLLLLDLPAQGPALGNRVGPRQHHHATPGAKQARAPGQGGSRRSRRACKDMRARGCKPSEGRRLQRFGGSTPRAQRRRVLSLRPVCKRVQTFAAVRHMAASAPRATSGVACARAYALLYRCASTTIAAHLGEAVPPPASPSSSRRAPWHTTPAPPLALASAQRHRRRPRQAGRVERCLL